MLSLLAVIESLDANHPCLVDSTMLSRKVYHKTAGTIPARNTQLQEMVLEHKRSTRKIDRLQGMLASQKETTAKLRAAVESLEAKLHQSQQEKMALTLRLNTQTIQTLRLNTQTIQTSTELQAARTRVEELQREVQWVTLEAMAGVPLDQSTQVHMPGTYPQVSLTA